MVEHENKRGVPIRSVDTSTIDLSSEVAKAIAELLRAAPKIALSGDISAAGGLADLIGFIHQMRWSGRLRVIETNAIRELRFLAGEVRGASSTQPGDRIGEILFRFGRISKNELDRALTKCDANKRLGQALVELGLIGSHDVFLFVKKQVEEVFFGLLSQRTGTYIFEREDSLVADRDMEADLGLSTRQLLFEGARLLDEMQYFKERIPSPSVVPVQRKAAAKVVPLGEDLRLVLSLVDGTRTVEELGRDSKLGEREATRALFQLMQAGHIELRDETDTLMTDRYGGPKRLIDFVNTFLSTVQETLNACGTPELLRSELEHFMKSTSKYSDLFAGVAIDDQAQIAETKILENLHGVRVPDSMQYLQRGFHELLCFLLFVVGDAVGPQRQKQLSLILLDANRSLDRDNRLGTPPQKVKVVVGGEEKLADLAPDTLEEALSTRDLSLVDEDFESLTRR
jgi:hypothetical protein